MMTATARTAAAFRAAARTILLAGWILACYLASLAASLGVKLRIRGAEACRARISQTWVRRVHSFLGTRIVVRGQPPPSPYFLVANHISWFDFFVMNAVCAGRFVVMAEAARLPLAGRLMTGLNPIYVTRTSADNRRVVDRIVEALRAGDNVALAPEAGTSPGREVHRFHAALLEAAVVTGKPVWWAAVTFRTPAGWPPASELIPFPDPYYPEAAAHFGEKKQSGWMLRFFLHLARLTSLPYHVGEVTFGADPIWAPDRVTLAARLEEAVRKAFAPLE
jgi:1-acyl-sn-glycerol-3-phosphate acyltransferase